MLAREAYDNVPVGRGPVGADHAQRVTRTGYNSPAARDADMQLYDALGPLSRKAIDDSPGEIVVALMLTQAPMECCSSSGWGYDDKRLAEWIKGQVRRRYGQPAESFELTAPEAARRRRF